MRTYFTFSGWVTIMALLLFPVAAIAAEARPPAKATYLRYCSACHGETGKGDGVVSGLMKPRPTDLTVLAKANNGDLPYGQLIHVIDGRQTIRAHGDPNMPVWGEVFKAEDGVTLAEEAKVRGQLLLIIEYLGAIQQH